MGESSKPQSPQNALLFGELEDAKRSLAHKEVEMRQLVERMQWLKDAQENKLEKGGESLEELQDITCFMEVKKKKKMESA